ncbi:hypothetical protein [Paenibacillus sp.]|uniref:hypothetical protein n=1 Tax=Paenibacillus sp. TaxID=58172 RepID=UPI0028122268|nr:hypothetical protein [Paenibacillus sp.]
MDMKKMGFADKAIFILGLTLCGVIAFVLVVGVIVALLKLFMDGKLDAIPIRSSPLLEATGDGDEPPLLETQDQGKDEASG